MQVRCDEGVAIHIDPKPCVCAREGAGEASAKCRVSNPQGPFEIGRGGGHVANSNLGNGNLPPETFGKTRQESP